MFALRIVALVCASIVCVLYILEGDALLAAMWAVVVALQFAVLLLARDRGL